MTPIDFIHDLRWEDLPPDVKAQTKRCLKDILGVAAGGLNTNLSRIVRDYAAAEMPGQSPILFDDRVAAPGGAALAMGMSIDSLDGHDGYNPAKGHIGCPLVPALLVFADQVGASGETFLTAMAMGYEVGARASEAQHATCPDYHTSGSWGAVVAAAAGARLLGLTKEETRHALGIAEYHGPRSQMMRCIDHPTMVKDGSGWGALAGVSAVGLARRGFTGAPALTVEAAAAHWTGLGSDWRILKQYFKPYPVCRWTQPPVEAVLSLRSSHGLRSEDVAEIRVETFHESVRLATATPATTEEAQYSTSFPCAVAMARGTITAADLDGPALRDPEILRLSQGLKMVEAEEANAVFPLTRLARVTMALKSGGSVSSDWHQPIWDWDAPPSTAALDAKFHSFAEPVLGEARTQAISAAVEALDQTPLSALTALVYGAPEPGAA